MFFYFGVKDGQQLEDTAIRLSETFPSTSAIDEDVLLNFLYLESEGKKFGLSAKEYAATTKKKREDTKKGKQHSKQPKRIAQKTKRHRAIT